jgi:BASS family bile acid:Na+ symporter
MLDFLFQHIDFLIDLILAFITMSLGLNLSKEDFTHIFTNPRALTIGLVAQMILLPLCALSLMLLSDFSPAIKVGFIIISLCPGGVTSNLVSYLLRGNVALSISLTVVNGILCMFTVPLLANLALIFFFNHTSTIELPVSGTILHIALVTVLPAAVGMLLRSKLPLIADRLRPILKYLLPALLLTIFFIKIFAPIEKGGIELKQFEIISIGTYALILNFSGMFVGFLLSSLFRIDIHNKVTIMVEVGLHNTALALLVAGNILKSPEMQKPAMVYLMFTFFSTLLFAWIIKSIATRYFEKKKI